MNTVYIYKKDYDSGIEWTEYQDLATQTGINVPLNKIMFIFATNRKERDYQNAKFTFQEFNKIYYSGYNFETKDIDIYDTALIKVIEIISAKYPISVDGNTYLKDIYRSQFPTYDVKDMYDRLYSLFHSEGLKIPITYQVASFWWGCLPVIFFISLIVLVITFNLSLFIGFFCFLLFLRWVYYSFTGATEAKEVGYESNRILSVQTFSRYVANLNLNYFLKSRNLTQEEAYRLTYDLFVSGSRGNHTAIEEKKDKICNLDFNIVIKLEKAQEYDSDSGCDGGGGCD